MSIRDDAVEVRAERASTAEPPREPLPSLSLSIACTLHALPLGWGAWVLPTQTPSWFTLTVGLLAALHATVALLALSKRPRALALSWTILSLYSLLLLVAVTWVIGSSALYLSELYRGVGRAVSAALFGVWGLFVLLTVPVSAWGLAYTLPRGRRARVRLGASAGVGLALALVSSLWVGRLARAAPVAGAESAAIAGLLGDVARTHAATSAPAPSLLQAAPIPCREPVDTQRLTLLLTGHGRDNQVFSACLQAAQPAQLKQALERLLKERAPGGSTLAIELVRAVQTLPRLHPLLDALSIRPARDGLCARGSCFAPWQLVTLDAFTRNRPLDAVKDASFGVSVDELARALGVANPSEAALSRIETASYVLQAREVTPYVRQRPIEQRSDAQAIERAVVAAGRHVLAAQRPDGSFRYLLWPFSGPLPDGELSLPRQAGTVLALCELVPGADSQAAVARALVQLRGFERAVGELSAISDSPDSASLGQSALPLIAFASCRKLVGSANDALIGRLARLLMAMQRPDGGFAPELDLHGGQARGRHAALYSAGQAVFALVLVEQLAKAGASPLMPEAARLGEAVERAMHFYASDYWPRPLRSLFYLEENWHCLAARAALTSHRHDAYERFCLDYVDFKSRLILSADSTDDVEHVGGYGLSSMFPPHSTATAGFAEALAAAMHVARARGIPLASHRARMREVLGFVLRQQWTQQSCFACAAGAEAVGGFSESTASPLIRIDYVQHALAALGHGAAAMALVDEGA